MSVFLLVCIGMSSIVFTNFTLGGLDPLTLHSPSNLLYFAWANQRRRQCCIRHTARFTWGARYTARHVITVIVLAFLTQENKAGKMQSTINQLKHGKGRAVGAIMVLGVVSLLHVQHFLPCFN